MGEVTFLDISIIIIYMVFLTYVGLRCSKKVEGTEDFFIADRNLPWFVLVATVCASVIGGSALIGKGGYAYTGGVVCIAIGLPYMIGLFIFSAFCGKISKMGHKYGFISMSEVMGYRFGKTVRVLSACLVIYTAIATVGAQISATGTILSTLGGDQVSYMLGAFIATIIFTAYTAGAGLFGVVYTDVIQFVVLISSVYIMLPYFSIQEVGGFAELIAKTSPEKWSWHFKPEIITLIVTNFIMTIAGAEFWQRAFAAKNHKAAFKGQFGGTVVYGITIVITMFIGLSAAILMPNLIEEYGTADYAIPVMIVKMLPAGLTGLAIAGVLSVMMSSADSYLLLASQAVLTDIYKVYNPNMSEKKVLRISRLAIVVFSTFAFLVAMFFQQAYDALMFGWTFYAATIGMPCFAAIAWDKATKQGILCGMFTGFVVSIGWKLMNNPFDIGSTIAGVLLNAVVLVIVSLATYKNNPSKTIEFEE